MLVTLSDPPPTIERLQRVNRLCGSSECYIAMSCIVLFLNRVLHGQSLQSNLVYGFANMHAMSYRSDFFTFSSGVKIWEPAVSFAISSLSDVIPVSSLSCLIPTTISHSKSLNTSLLEVMISSKHEAVFISELRNLTLQIIFDAWWALMNVDSKRPIAWHNSRHAPSWRFYSHCGIDVTGSPGIICIVCHQVLRHPSEHGTSSMGKHSLAKVHIAKLN